MSQYLHLNETLKGLLCQELIFPQIMTRRNADEFAQKLPLIQVGLLINYVDKQNVCSKLIYEAEMGLPLPNRKLFVPRSECFVIVRENPTG